MIDLHRIRRYALSTFACGPYSIHGPDHWQRVEDVGLELARDTGADETVVSLFAILHDSCRQNDGRDPFHGPRAADMLGSIAADLLDLDRERLVLLEHAIRHHTAGLTSTDPTIGTCWDADRLDLGRVGMRPRERFMSTWAGRRRARRL
ncbi:MAG TPA: hypothetical protein VLT32_17825 [Candidatus Sulfomarinibacteraceae bacterium]|nr:hypothetical protein [Candidatus Sulfomarinibacteraceae bacterium]